MKSLVFSDIHASKDSAKIVEKLSKDYDEILCCGDVCGYGSDYGYVIDMFRDLKVRSVLGNHDYMLIHKSFDLNNIIPRVAIPIRRTRRDIEKDDLEYIRNLPMSIETKSGIFVRHTVLIDCYVTKAQDCEPLLRETDLNIICIGHTHIMGKYVIDGRVVINVGSITHGRRGNGSGYASIEDGRIILFSVDGHVDKELSYKDWRKE